MKLKETMISLSLIFCLTVCMLSVSVFAGEDEDTQGMPQEATWQTDENGDWTTGSFQCAIDRVYDGGTVKLLTDVTLEKTAEITKSMTITSADDVNPSTITGIDDHGYLLNVYGLPSSEQVPALTLSNVIVDGGSTKNLIASRGLIAVGNASNAENKGGQLKLDSGAVLQNNDNHTEKGVGGGICVINGEAEMNIGAAIQHCAAKQGGAVAIVNSNENRFTMNGGTITDNRATTGESYGEGGGAVYQSAGSFTMNNGVMSGNHGQCGGAVYLTSSKPTFNFAGGRIEENTAVYGGGIYANQSREINLSGGTISGNRASSNGGGLLIAPWNTLNLSGNLTITSNTSGTEEPKTPDNLYIDGYTDNRNPVMAKATITSALTGQIGISTWLKPGTEAVSADKLLIAGGDTYTLGAGDLAMLRSDNYTYHLEEPDDKSIVLACGHVHRGGTATCSSKAICEQCNEEYGELDPMNHQYGNRIEEKAPTYTEDGMKAHYVCALCNHYFDEHIQETTAEALIIPKKRISSSAYYPPAVNKEDEQIDAIKKVQLVARSENSMLNGKKAIRVYWFAKDGRDIRKIFDGFEVYRSAKRDDGYEKFFNTKGTTYRNNKALKKGVKYYYRVRGYAVLNSKTYYSDWSLRAIRYAR